jgi:hypothetical protein
MIPKLRMRWHQLLYQSATLTGNGNSGIFATPAQATPTAIVPVMFTVAGTGLATDETAAVTLNWFADPVLAVALGTTTFDGLTAGSPADNEVWPGDFTFYNVARDIAPMPPYATVAWTLGGSSISLSIAVYASYWTLDA